MISNRFIIILGASLLVYFVLDYVFNNMMLYMVGGVVGGSIGEAFKAVGIKAGIGLIGLVWAALLIGVIYFYYRTNSNAIKYILIFLIGLLLYLVDMLFASLPYSDTADEKNIVLISNVVIGIIILLKSVILSWLIYTGIVKN